MNPSLKMQNNTQYGSNKQHKGTWVLGVSVCSGTPCVCGGVWAVCMEWMIKRREQWVG